MATILVAAPAGAKDKLKFEPITEEGASVRYEQGVATLDRQATRGAVQVTPLGLDHDRLTFGIAVFNLGDQSDNFGVEDVRVQVAGTQFAVLTREQLDKKAKNRAMWSQIGVALLAGAAAGAAASSTNHYTATTYTPRGTYRTHITAPSVGGQIAANNITRDGGYAIGAIQARLDATRHALANEIVQTTTVDPDDSYGGRFVVSKLKGPAAKWPQDVLITVTFNGEEYPFTFRVTRNR
ncbi:hypothetical protein [Sphingosinicella rhizophila]|uniref:Uncharacterized protein n=1 Tax=Sphingosinicella rhizophila TaxID=3050082 RepID=A0ABU3Q5H0_9SPHN|nr:hypothetical protein [Sphingosinicella sp. GR2756]MDT9598646.1 hypothetical protein [Sphingosinicella sp. GR2756]